MKTSLCPLSRAAVVGVLFGLGCQQPTSNVQPRNFDRPERVAFACFDNDAGTFLALSSCAGLELDGEAEDVALIALVTQTAKGEVAAIDVDDRLVLDTDERIPGFTFVLVGENPSGIAVPTVSPNFLYVTNRTSRTLSYVPLDRVHPEAVPTGLRRGDLALPGAPADLAISPGEDFLYVSFPERGTVGEYALTGDGDEPVVFVREIALGTTPTATVPALDTETYERICPMGFEASMPVPELGAPRTEVSLGATAAPTRFAVDADASPPVLLVADGNLPMIHRLELSGTGADEGALEPLAPAVPTRDLALTPPVPAELGVLEATERYLYAIDATDNSVLVMDYTASSASFGAVLPVETGHRPFDRLTISGGASVLRVVTSDYVVTGGEAPTSCDPSDSDEAEDALPTSLRGVFLMVGRLDGAVGIVDVFDLDASCRGGASCTDPARDADVHVRIRRHRPRLGPIASSAVELLGLPSVSFDGSPGQLRADGTPTTGSGPRMDVLDTCPTGMIAVFPEDAIEEPVICVSADSWANPNQQWVGGWESAIPGAVGAGRFDASDPDLFVTTDARFCEWGVLGESDVTASALSDDDPLAGYVGDSLVLSGELSPSIQAALAGSSSSAFEVCRKFLDHEDRDPIFLEIVEAYDGAVRVRQPVARRLTGEESEGAAPTYYTLDEVRTCFPGVAPFFVRARSSYVVTSFVNGLLHVGFLHRVHSDGGACRVNPAIPFDPDDPQTHLASRARPGRTFINPYIAFRVGTTRADGSTVGSMEGIDSVVRVTTQGIPVALAVRVAQQTQVSDISGSPTGHEFFTVDPSISAFHQYEVETLQHAATFQ